MRTKDDRYWMAGGRKLVPTQTSASAAFVIEHAKLMSFMTFSHGSFLRTLDEAQEREDQDVAKSLVDIDGQLRILNELVLTRTVDNFLCFVADLLSLIYKSRPEMLRSSEQEKLEFILSFSDMDQLRNAIAEKRVESLTYKGLRELSTYIEEKMEFPLFEDPEEMSQAALLVELRNICVHSRGYIRSVSARRFPELKKHLGQMVNLSFDTVRQYRQFLENAVFDIDVRATEKFKLPSYVVPEPPAELLKDGT